MTDESAKAPPPFTFDTDKFRVPDLRNATAEFCVDEYVELKKVEKFTKKYLEILKAAINARRADKEIVNGSKEKAIKVQQMPGRMTLDLELLKADYPDLNLANYMKQGESFQQFNVVDKEPEPDAK
jgi:hypothetical protein